MESSKEILFKVSFSEEALKNLAIGTKTKILGGNLVSVNFDAQSDDWHHINNTRKPPKNTHVLFFAKHDIHLTDGFVLAYFNGTSFLDEEDNIITGGFWHYLPDHP